MKPEMTRRCACGLLLGDLLGTVACSCSSRSVARALHKYATEQNLAMVEPIPMGYGDFSEVHAIRVGGGWAGKVVIPESQCPNMMSVSPDGRWLAWDNRSAERWPLGTGAPLQVFITNAPQSVRSLDLTRNPNLRGYAGRQLAISSGAEHLALVLIPRKTG